ncbi:hypothetical protein ACC690_37320, partial [Rhizobium johnstonii]|uniref:hypothetical protein n=1 Tax=Rhizobium johnstonii TaxID=3019933 RepID=UPI003F9EA24B
VFVGRQPGTFVFVSFSPQGRPWDVFGLAPWEKVVSVLSQCMAECYLTCCSGGAAAEIMKIYQEQV